MTLANLSVVQVLVLLLPAAIPFAVDLVTKASAPAALKSALALFLSCILGAVQAAVVAPNERWQDYVAGIVYTAVVAFVTHYTGVTNGLERRTARFGIAGPRSARTGARRTASASVGTVSVTLVPDTRLFSAKLRQAADVFDSLGDAIPPEH